MDDRRAQAEPQCTDAVEFLRLLHKPGDVFEVRSLNCPERRGGTFKNTASGYFSDLDAAAHAVRRLEELSPPGIYVTLNPTDPRLLARSVNRMTWRAKETTSNAAITSRRWLLLDIDPIRPSGVSATDAEMTGALELAESVREALARDGWPGAVFGMSGNGAYLLFRVEMLNDDFAADLFKRALHGIGNRFDTESCRIDRSVYNAARLVKLLGTVARKGDDLRGVKGIDDRPHRRSWFRPPRDVLEPVSVGQLETVADDPDRPSSRRTSNCATFEGRGDVDWPERCRNYIAKLPDAISGQDGHGKTFRAARECFRFGLSDAEAREVMAWFNEHKTGGECWTTSQLEHKLTDAKRKVEAAGEIGIRRNGNISDRPRAPSRKQHADRPHRHNEEVQPAQNRTVSDDDLPMVMLPGQGAAITSAGKQLGTLLGGTGRFFRRGTAVVTVDREDGVRTLRSVNAAGLASAIEAVATLVQLHRPGGKLVRRPATCNKAQAELILNAEAFTQQLPPIKVLSRCPLLVERDGELVQVSDYDPVTGILAEGEPAEDIEVEDARGILDEVLADFRFTSPSDESRAAAAIITPALVMGGLLPGRAPIDLGEADDTQAGKGFRNKLIAAVYRQEVTTVTQKRGGVGSLEESFNAALIRGAIFVSIDNVRGKFDSPAIESFMTEDQYLARESYSRNVEIDPRRIMVMMTSNKAELTRDQANRCACVRILKQPGDYQFASYSEGDILAHVCAHQPRFLGAVFAIVRAWWAAGCPRLETTGHDFRTWAGVLDWIVQKLLGKAPLLTGHLETANRMTTPVLSWLRDLAIAVQKAERLGENLRTHVLLDLLEGADVEIPGMRDHEDLGDTSVREKALLAIGRKLGRCFGGRDSLTVDHLRVDRIEETDDQHRPCKVYRFDRAVTDPAIRA